jgi:hypothetical protein
MRILILCSLGLLMIPFILTDHASTEPSTGRLHMKRPSRDAIEIRDVSLHHIANGQSGERYQVQMSIHNSDANWSATEICVHVRFRDPAKKLVDAHQTACLQNLNPLEQRRFMLIYGGSFPRSVSQVIPELQVSSVKWALSD